MSYIALYRKWRPSVFEDVVEQEHVVKTLKNSISTGRIAHAYLFCGTRGTGKTTMAKIFSRAINCLNPKDGNPCNECDICRGILSQTILDVVEIDAASNNSVDNVREIRDEVIYAPSQSKYKVYIIDEVHMLSSGAFNALLKTLEEPPSHVVFILATTEPHKLPATILSRCQRFDFRRIPVESIVGRLNKIAQAGGVTIQTEAARLIAKMSDGALRDAISILDQCIGIGNKEITHSDVLSVVGIVNDSFIGDMVDAVIARNISEILRLVDILVMDGKDIVQFVSNLVLYYRNLLICKITDKPAEVIDLSEEGLQRMKNQSSSFGQDEIICTIKDLSQLESGLKWATQPRILLEVALVKLCDNNTNVDTNDIMGRLSILEKKISEGSFVVSNVKTDGGSDTVKVQQAQESRLPKKPAPAEERITPVSSGETKTLADWEGVINELKNSGRMVLYTNLFGTKAIELDQRFVGVVFGKGSGFSRTIVAKPENLEVLEGIIANKLGREIKVKCVDEESLKNEKKESNKAEKDELVEKARDIAKRLNTSLNIIDE